MPLLIDQHTGSAIYIETIRDDSFFIFTIADAVEFFLKVSTRVILEILVKYQKTPIFEMKKIPKTIGRSHTCNLCGDEYDSHEYDDYCSDKCLSKAKK